MRMLERMARLLLGTRSPRSSALASSGRSPGGDAAEFALDVAVPTNVEIMNSGGGGNRSEAVVAQQPHLHGAAGLVLRAGQCLATPFLTHDAPPTLRLTLTCAPGRATVTVHVDSEAAAGTTRVRHASVVVGGSEAPERVVELTMNAAPTAVRYLVHADDGNTIPVAITGLLVGSAHRLGRLHAMSSYESRLRNEVQHFSGAAYTHKMYGDSATSTATGVVGTAAAAMAAAPEQQHAAVVAKRVNATLAAMDPMPEEVAINYCMRALYAVLPVPPPDFLTRANRLGGDHPLRMLSICAGAGRVEEEILKYATRPIHMTLLDASRELIERASGRLATVGSQHTVDCMVADVNGGLPGAGQFDVVVCVSALHHIADLETVLAHVNGRLAETGEFWSIGEQVGRNGNRLWPPTLAAANRAFAQLPPHLRKNRHSGATDTGISDRDFSVGCFEGIRSEELEAQLEAHLIPVDVHKRNCFLWRLVDTTYADNFDLAKAEDLACLRQLVVAEAVHWATGGRATELHGVYRKKTVR